MPSPPDEANDVLKQPKWCWGHTHSHWGENLPAIKIHQTQVRIRPTVQQALGQRPELTAPRALYQPSPPTSQVSPPGHSSTNQGPKGSNKNLPPTPVTKAVCVQGITYSLPQPTDTFFFLYLPNSGIHESAIPSSCRFYYHFWNWEYKSRNILAIIFDPVKIWEQII